LSTALLEDIKLVNGVRYRALYGINCHFADEYGDLKTFLLALPQQEGKHTGANIAETVAEIITHFDLRDNIGFFNADNASNNDTFSPHSPLSSTLTLSRGDFAALATSLTSLHVPFYGVLTKRPS
jgi:hypothetical protein